MRKRAKNARPEYEISLDGANERANISQQAAAAAATEIKATLPAAAAVGRPEVDPVGPMKTGKRKEGFDLIK